MLRLGLTLGLFGGDDDVASLPDAASDITWTSRTIAEDADLGDNVGSTLSATGGEGVTFTIPDAASLFIVDGTQVKLAGVLDYETATSHNVTVRATSTGGNYYEELFAVTVTDVSEDVPGNPPPPDPDPVVDDENNFDIVPYAVEVSGSVKFAGKKKNNGLSAKFMHDFSGEIGAFAANSEYIFSFTADFSQMANDGHQTSVGLMLKTGNDFYSIGVKGDGGATNLDAYQVSDGTNKWNQTTGYTITNEGDVAHGTQWADIWVKVITSEDGTTLTLQTGTDIDTWDDDIVDVDLGPFTDVTDVDKWGIGGIFDSDDAGAYSIDVIYWAIEEVAVNDPHWDNVAFLWEAEGTNGAQSGFSDATGKIMSSSGTGAISNTRSRFGSTSFSVGTGGGGPTQWSPDFNFGGTNTTPWTIEFSAYQTVRQTWEIMTLWAGSGSTNNSWWVRLQSDGQIRLLASSDGSTSFSMDQTTTGVGIADAAWADICIEKNSSGKIRIYKDGIMKWSATPANSAFFAAVSQLMTFGINGNPNGWIDHIRITKNVARYDSDSGYTFVESAFPVNARIGDTWNPADKASTVALSGHNLTARATSAAGAYSMVRSNIGKNAGKHYFELTVTGTVATNMIMGIANASATLTSYVGLNNHSIGLSGDGNIVLNSSVVGTATNPASGDIVSVAVDRDNHKIWFRVNGGNWNNAAIGSQDPASNIGGQAISAVVGTIYPAWNGYSGSAPDICVANFGNSAFAYAVPSGFNAGWLS